MEMKDPVCGMQVDETKAAATTVYQGTAYAFCSTACKNTFEKSPTKFLGQASASKRGC